MYAYKQQFQYDYPHALPQRTARKKPLVLKNTKKKIKPKKKNVILEFFRFLVTISFLSAFAIFILPTAYNSLIKQVFYPSNLHTSIGYEDLLLKENPAYSKTINLYSLAFPISNYLNNDLFLNQNLLTPTIQKVHSEVTTMYQTGEMEGLKKQLLSLANQYQKIIPSIYVWEYEQGVTV